MTITEAIALREKLEIEILQLLHQYQDRTGLRVTGVDLLTLGRRVADVYGVTVTVEV